MYCLNFPKYFHGYVALPVSATLILNLVKWETSHWTETSALKFESLTTAWSFPCHSTIRHLIDLHLCTRAAKLPLAALGLSKSSYCLLLSPTSSYGTMDVTKFLFSRSRPPTPVPANLPAVIHLYFTWKLDSYQKCSLSESAAIQTHSIPQIPRSTYMWSTAIHNEYTPSSPCSSSSAEKTCLMTPKAAVLEHSWKQL